MVSTGSTPSNRPEAGAEPQAQPQPEPGADTASSAASGPSPSRAEQTTNNINDQIRSAIPSKIPTSPNELPSLPTLDDDTASPIKRLRSHLVLTVLVCGIVGVGWLVGFDLLQVKSHDSWLELLAVLSGIALVSLAILHWVGIAQIDFWAMVHEYWWISVPIAVSAVGLATLMQEGETNLQDVE